MKSFGKRWDDDLRPIVLTWSPLWVSVIAVGLSILSLKNSNFAINEARKANDIAEKNHKLTRQVERLDLRPQIKFGAEFNQIKDIPAHFFIKNSGPVEAVQVQVEFFIHRYSEKERKIKLRLSGSDWLYDLPELKPQERKSYPLPQDLLSNVALIGSFNVNALEARITYLRNPDRKVFSERAFYLLNPNGFLVSLSDKSISGETYGNIKKAILSNNVPEVELMGGYDQLFPLEPRIE